MQDKIIIDCRMCRDRFGLYQLLVSQKIFPSYFGCNWDAFEECWLDMIEDGYVTEVDFLHSDQLLADDNEGKIIFNDIISRSNGEEQEIRKLLVIFK